MLDVVNGRVFLADDVGAATGVAGQALTNLLTRSDLQLASSPPGRGKSRPFPLIDVYQIALAGDLLRATGSMQRAAQIANRFLETMVSLPPEGMPVAEWTGVVGAAVRRDGHNRNLPPEISTAIAIAEDALAAAAVDIKNASPMYWSREVERQFYLIADIGGAGFDPLPYAYVSDNPLSFLDFKSGSYATAIVINLTKLFDRVDQALAKRLNRA